MVERWSILVEFCSQHDEGHRQ